MWRLSACTGEVYWLNQIATQYQAMAETEQIKYKAMLEAEPHLTIKKAMDLAARLSEYEFTPLPCDKVDFFKEYLFHHLDIHMDRRWLFNIAVQAEGSVLPEYPDAGAARL